MELGSKGIEKNNIAFGFFDESSPQTTSNTVRIWSFIKKVRIKKNTARIKANEAGFYTLKGHSIVFHMEHSKEADICDALKKIQKANDKYKAIVMVLDNFSSHKTKKVLDLAKSLNIYLVFLPCYSPELNPIEYIWKSIKRVVSTTFIENKLTLCKLIEKHFRWFSMKLSFAKSWIDNFFNPFWESYTTYSK